MTGTLCSGRLPLKGFLVCANIEQLLTNYGV